jgi:tRNA U34 5-methylaminomethyl-2-thiouridine-forming methyltransferase MnmC
MERKLITTGDGSKTLFVSELNEHYHSTHGALAEARHVFIKNGLIRSGRNPISILEIGLGTGLNALLTCIEAEKLKIKTKYFTIEKYPVSLNEAQNMGYVEMIGEGEAAFADMHNADWEVPVVISPHFTLNKIKADIEGLVLSEPIDVIYFDAFAPEKQPKMWEPQVFDYLFKNLTSGGFLTTYCAKGVVKRTLKSVGFIVEGVPGPPGKREMIIATKP